MARADGLPKVAPTILHPTTDAEWEQAGREALLDLLADKWVVPWAEAEARIWRGWKNYPHVQPLQLGAARRQLRNAGAILEHQTRHKVPVHTVHLPFPPGKRRELQRLAGARSKKFQKFLAWAGDYDLCGRNGERVVLASLQAAASESGLYVPGDQDLGDIREVDGVHVQRGTFDVLAHILEVPRLDGHTPVVVEVKNIHRWIYPRAPELWELLVKAADLYQHLPVLPVLVCVRYSYLTQRMAADLGFLVAGTQEQLFSPKIPERQFENLKEEFGMAMVRQDGPRAEVVKFGRFLRQTPFRGPEPWYRRQVNRFRSIAPVVLAHDALAGELPSEVRKRTFASFRSRALAIPNLTFTGLW